MTRGLTHAETRLIHKATGMKLVRSYIGLLLWIRDEGQDWYVIELARANGVDWDTLKAAEAYLRSHPEADPDKLLHGRTLAQAVQDFASDPLYDLGYYSDYFLGG